MPEENRPPHSEIFFLPPLTMVLSFFDGEIKSRHPNREAGEDTTESKEQTVTKLIAKLSEKENKD